MDTFPLVSGTLGKFASGHILSGLPQMLFAIESIELMTFPQIFGQFTGIVQKFTV